MKAKLQDIPGVGTETTKLLRRAGLNSVESVAVTSANEIRSILDITELTAQKIVNGARQIVGLNTKLVAGETVLLDLLDLPKGKMAYAYVKGHLVIQTNCTKEEAEELIKMFNRTRILEKEMLAQLERAEQAIKESENRSEEIKQLDKKLTSIIKKDRHPDSMYG